MSETPPYFTRKAHQVIVDAVGPDQLLQWSSYDHDLMNLAREADARIASLESALASATLRAEIAEEEVKRLRINNRHFDILAEAMAEVKATSDGMSDQPIADIVAGCLAEIAALPLAATNLEREQSRKTIADLREALEEAREVIDTVAGDNRPAREWATTVRDKIDAALQTMRLSEAQRRAVDVIWEKTGGKAWEPKNTHTPLIEAMIAAGYVRRVDGRCGFERIKDAMLDWTEAGRRALKEQP